MREEAAGWGGGEHPGLVWGEELIVSGAQQSDSAIGFLVSLLPEIPFPSRLSHNIEQGSLCDTVASCWLSILNMAVCTCPSQTP